MKFSKKFMTRLVIFLVVFAGLLIVVDELTTYRVHCYDVYEEDGYLCFETSSGTSVGLFSEAKLKEIEPGIYSIETHYSLLHGEPGPYVHKIDNRDGRIKELREYDWDHTEEYRVLYKEQ